MHLHLSDLTQLENSLCQLLFYQAHFDIEPTSSFKELRRVFLLPKIAYQTTHILTYLLTYLRSGTYVHCSAYSDHDVSDICNWPISNMSADDLSTTQQQLVNIGKYCETFVEQLELKSCSRH